MEPINVLEYEALAQARMVASHWDYYAGGSDDEVTLRANRAAFERIRLRPRVLVDVSQIELATTVLGVPVQMPILVAPTALHGLAHDEGECATARAAGAAGTLMTVSTSATRHLEDIAQAATGPLWFQLYIWTYRQAEELVRRAEAAGYRAIVLTVDLPKMGNREKDRRNGLHTLHSTIMRTAYETEEDPAPIVATLTWDVLDWLRARTALPVMVKGILTAEDAALAIERGAAGVVVSNHGGRQLDTAISAIEALPEVVAAVAGRGEVYLDGGIRRGTDVLKALALGARAVLVGRPILWGLAARGEEGVRHVLALFHDELELAMGLAGCPTLASVAPALVRLP
ncbi:MAG: alpha-hydroxy-acid oxidizing protein [Ktedonobacterales bacterium]|nr:alpha-hydroxy-acid oxidizing protein [Ktedonobacterales bacterium]